MRSVFLALSILFSCFWAAAVAAYDSELGFWELAYQKGFTMQKSPTIYVDAWGIPWTRFFSVRFTLVDSRSMRPVAEVPLCSQEHPGPQRIDLGDYGIELESDVDYRWYVSINLSSRLSEPEEMTNERTKLAEGKIVRLVPKSLHAYGPPCEKSPVGWVADTRVWYDAFACVNELLEASPGDRALRYLRDKLLGKCRAYDGMPILGWSCS